MIKTINLGEREESVKALEILKEDNKTSRDIQITNSHITVINELTGKNLFRNNLLYINSKTLYEIMKDDEGKGQHNYHGLTPEDVYMALSSIKDPKYVFIAKLDNRYATISVELSHFDLPLMMVIQTNASLMTNIDTLINKVVTIYPKDHVDAYIEKLEKRMLLYEKP